MKRILTISTLALFFALGFSACEKIEKDTPPAIKKIIRDNRKAGGQVLEYRYNNESIYVYWGPCDADGEDIFYNGKGVELWRNGEMGIRGNVPEGFYTNAVFKRIVWTDKFTKECMGDSKVRPVQSPEG